MNEHIYQQVVTTFKGTLNEFSMATITSLALVLDLKGYYATMDSRQELAILICKPNGQMQKFKQYRVGLYYLDTARADLHI